MGCHQQNVDLISPLTKYITGMSVLSNWLDCPRVCNSCVGEEEMYGMSIWGRCGKYISLCNLDITSMVKPFKQEGTISLLKTSISMVTQLFLVRKCCHLTYITKQLSVHLLTIISVTLCLMNREKFPPSGLRRKTHEMPIWGKRLKGKVGEIIPSSARSIESDIS